MKIAILTLPLHTNYGGILQAYALQTVLERMGHEVVVLNKKKRIVINWCKYPFQITKRIIARYLFHRQGAEIFYEVKRNWERSRIEKYTSRFISKYINNLYYQTIDDLENLNYDAIVVGSDQVWSNFHGKNIGGSVLNAYLPFAVSKPTKRISYAASFGKDTWDYSDEETKYCRELIKHFDCVSVREESAILLCKQYLDIDAQCHLDPTLLLNSDDYLQLLQIDKVAKSEGNLLLYYIDKTDDKANVAKLISEELQYTPFEVNSRVEDMSGNKFSISDCIQPPVEKWVRGFYDADFVVTDSYHACVFSILFHKPFIAVGNSGRGLTRFESLFSMLNLNSRLIDCSGQLSHELITCPIDWADVTNRLDSLRRNSIKYLDSCL